MRLRRLALVLATRLGGARSLVEMALSQPLTDELRRVVWRAQYEIRRAEGGEEVQVSDDAISTLVERRISNAAQRRQDEAAYEAMMAHLRSKAGLEAASQSFAEAEAYRRMKA